MSEPLREPPICCPHCGKPVFGSKLIEWGGWALDASQQTVHTRGKSVKLTRQKLVRLLELLIQAHGRVLSTETLMQLLYPDGRYPASDSIIKVFISQLRKQLEDGKLYRAITTIYKEGYKLEAFR